MSKLISFCSLRSGVGRTSITCLIGNALAKKGYKTLIIDNNKEFCDIEKYLLVHADHGVDTISPFIKSGILKKETIESIVVNVEKNLYILAGTKTKKTTDNTLKAADISTIKSILDSEYDFILIDLNSGLDSDEIHEIAEITDIPLIISQLSKADKEHFRELKTQISNTNPEKANILKNVLDKSYLIYNKVENNDFRKGSSFPKDRIFKVNYSSKLLDFCNGFTADIFEDNQEEVAKIISSILNKEVAAIDNKFKIKDLLKNALRKISFN